MFLLNVLYICQLVYDFGPLLWFQCRLIHQINFENGEQFPLLSQHRVTLMVRKTPLNKQVDFSISTLHISPQFKFTHLWNDIKSLKPLTSMPSTRLTLYCHLYFYNGDFFPEANEPVEYK